MGLPLMQVIPSSWLKMFNPHEVNELLGGGESGTLNVQDMAAHANYSGGYSKDDPTVKLFWKVISSIPALGHVAHGLVLCGKQKHGLHPPVLELLLIPNT